MPLIRLHIGASRQNVTTAAATESPTVALTSLAAFPDRRRLRVDGARVEEKRRSQRFVQIPATITSVWKSKTQEVMKVAAAEGTEGKTSGRRKIIISKLFKRPGPAG